MTFSTVFKFSALTLAAGLSVGCATNGDLERVRQESLDAANRAQTTANTALATANEAKAAAQESLACCNANTEKLNRVFNRAMLK